MYNNLKTKKKKRTTQSVVKGFPWNTDQLAVEAVLRRRISFVAQFDSVFVFPVFDRRPIVSISDMGSVSTTGISWTPNAVHKSLK